MTTVPGSLVWEIVKKQNFFRQWKPDGSVQQSNNLYNLNSFKYSGLANKKIVTVQSAGKDLGVTFATIKTNKQNQPSKILHKVVMNKEFTKMAKVVANQRDCIHESTILQKKYEKKYERQKLDYPDLFNASTSSRPATLKNLLNDFAMQQHKMSFLNNESVHIDQWVIHSQRGYQCRMKMARILTGVGD